MKSLAYVMLMPPFMEEFAKRYSYVCSHDTEMGRNLRDHSWRAQSMLGVAEEFHIPFHHGVRDKICLLTQTR